MTPDLSRRYINALLREFPDFTYMQAVRLSERLLQEDRLWFCEQVLADLGRLPVVTPL